MYIIIVFFFYSGQLKKGPFLYYNTETPLLNSIHYKLDVRVTFME